MIELNEIKSAIINAQKRSMVYGLWSVRVNDAFMIIIAHKSH